MILSPAHVDNSMKYDLNLYYSNDGGDHLDGIRGSITHSSSSSFDTGLPEGWESAIDKDGRLYYIK